MTSQQRSAKYKRMAAREALHVKPFLEYVTGCEVTMTDVEPKHVKFEAGEDALHIDGNTWMDFYINLCAVEEVVEFVEGLRKRG